MDQLTSRPPHAEDAPSEAPAAADPFPKHHARLKPYRLPYYVAGLVLLIACFPALRHRAGALLGTRAGQIEVSGTLGEAPASPGAVPATIAKAEMPAAPPSPPAETAAASDGSAATRRPVLDDPQFVVGDRLKISFYERIESEEDKWAAGKGRDQRRAASFHMRIEYSGEFVIHQNGAVSIPLLGNFEAEGRTSQHLQASLTKAFEAAVERQGIVSIALVERPPVYILGPVRAPGAFKHVPGMTVMHVVALAGGLYRDEQMNWQLVDFARETDKHETTIERTKRLLARHAVLVAERDNRPVAPPAKLIALSSPNEAQSLVAAEENVRKLTVSSYMSRQKALQSAIQLATSEIDSLSQRLEPLDASLKMRGERLRNFDRLNDKGLSNSNMRLQAQSELLELESRRQDVVAAIAQARQKLAIAQQDLESGKLSHLSDLEKEIVTVEFDLPLALRALTASDGILGVMKARGPAASEATLSYQILRKTASGPKFVKAEPTTLVEFGDVVHVSAASASRGR